MWKIIVIVVSVVVVSIILLFIIWRRRKKGHCGGSSSTHEALPTEIPPQNNTSEDGQTSSIPTYRECLDGSDRIVAEKAPLPSYQDVQEHKDYYA